MLEDDGELVEDWETEWVNDATGASQQVEWFVEDADDDKQSSKVTSRRSTSSCQARAHEHILV